MLACVMTSPMRQMVRRSVPGNLAAASAVEGTGVSRRAFLTALTGVIAGAAWPAVGVAASFQRRATGSRPFFRTRGVVLVPEDLTWLAWPERARQAGLSTIALHHGASPKYVSDLIQSERGREFLTQCRELGLQVEHELHAMRDLLPRELFAKNPELFRMNDKGERTADCNLCVHAERALDIAAEHAVALAKVLKPTTHRYFYWGDDAQPWCRCPHCRELSESDQALVLENHLLKALRRQDSRALLAHLAYANTLTAPTQSRPARGIFLEFAPIKRRYDLPLDTPGDPENRRHLEALDANLKVFGAANAQVLEYWLDVSRFSKWKKPAVKLPFDERVLAADLDTYGGRGIRHVTTFAVFIDADYMARFGEPAELQTYGQQLGQWRPKRSRL
jgi:hypothetical protein